MKNKAIIYQWLNSVKHLSRHKRVSEYSVAYFIITYCFIFENIIAVQALNIMNMEQSMSRKGDCWDNAPTERFFRSLKHEQLNYERFRTKEAAKLSVVDYVALL